MSTSQGDDVSKERSATSAGRTSSPTEPTGLHEYFRKLIKRVRVYLRNPRARPKQQRIAAHSHSHRPVHHHHKNSPGNKIH